MWTTGGPHLAILKKNFENNLQKLVKNGCIVIPNTFNRFSALKIPSFCHIFHKKMSFHDVDRRNFSEHSFG